MRRLCQSLALALCGLPLVLDLPMWAITSWVGGCWGALLLSGMSAVWTTQRLACALYVLCMAVAAHASLGTATDLGWHARWLVVVTLLASGWLMGVTLLPWHESTRTPGLAKHSHTRSGEPIRFSIWDIFCATAFVAMFCWALPRTENQFDLMCQIAPALLGGIVLSLIALQWAWHDQWSLLGLATLLGSLPMIVLLLMPWTDNMRSFTQILTWVLAGPLSVMAAQFIVVLVWLAALRPSCRSQMDARELSIS